jgi:tetratricopeptide (TPR) repeat protein
MNPPPPSPDNLDVRWMLEASIPRRRIAWVGYGMGVFLVAMLASSVLGEAGGGTAMRALAGLVILMAIPAMMIGTWMTARGFRAEQANVEAAEELVQLRRWPEAAAVLRGLLSRPTRTPQARVQGLIFLANVLSRYHRFEDAVLVFDHLLETLRLDPAAEHALKLGRGIALLREEHLYDADRAIADLRRSPLAPESGGLALLEMFRDVKTGHPAEALETFSKRLAVIRQQLGHRAGDAYALAAKAYDLLGQEAEAKTAYEAATALAPIVELNRRYPEVATLAGKYAATPAPAEAA